MICRALVNRSVQRKHQKYDLVVSDSFIINSETSTKLYTADHFHNCRQALKRDGLLITWIPTDIGTRATMCILRTLGSVFPYNHVYYPNALLSNELFAVSHVAPIDILARQQRQLQRRTKAAMRRRRRAPPPHR